MRRGFLNFWFFNFWISVFWISGFLNFWLLNFWLFEFLYFEFLVFWNSYFLNFWILSFWLFEFMPFWISGFKMLKNCTVYTFFAKFLLSVCKMYWVEIFRRPIYYIKNPEPGLDSIRFTKPQPKISPSPLPPF